MKAIKTISGIRSKISSFKMDGKTIGFVPTMGALHKGHISLIELAKEHADEVVVSIYVNPTQFGPDEDFEEYPRTLQEDVCRCEQLGVSAIFAPTDAIMYADETFLRIQIDTLNAYMDGASRPDFFEGILLIVNKLFNIVTPDIAVFGQKDIQQFQIMQHMVDEFNHDVELIMGPIVRANDGLALSSRNTYLNDEQRLKAPGLYRSLLYIEKQIEDGAKRIPLLLKHQKQELEENGFKIDYLSLFSSKTMAPVDSVQAVQKYILAGAVYLGQTRLIDNVILELQD